MEAEMALDIGIGLARQLHPDPSEPVVHVELAEYEFMYPWFERLHAQTGEMIDLYGDARFDGPALDSLSTTVAMIRSEVESQPRSWRKTIAQATYPNRPGHPVEDIQVHQGPLLELVIRWQAVIDRARETGRPVVCFGD
jgi:hypothetical protein